MPRREWRIRRCLRLARNWAVFLAACGAAVALMTSGILWLLPKAHALIAGPEAFVARNYDGTEYQLNLADARLVLVNGNLPLDAEHGALPPDAQYTLWGVLVAFIFAFFVLAIPRWFLCRGTMQFSFIGAFLILLAAQLISAFSLNNTTPDVGNVLWVIVTGLLLVFLITCAVCTVSAGLTALVNYFIAKYRMAHAKPVTT